MQLLFLSRVRNFLKIKNKSHSRFFYKLRKQKHKIKLVKKDKEINLKYLIRPNLSILTIGTIGLIISAGITMLIPGGIGYVLNSIGSDNNVFKKKYIYSAIGLLLISFFASLVRNYFFKVTSDRIILMLRKLLFNKLLNKKIKFFDSVKPGKLISKINADVYLVANSVSGLNLERGLKNFAQAIFSFSAMLYISPKLCLYFIPIVPILSIYSLYYGKKVKKISLSVQNRLGENSFKVEEALSNIKTIKSFGMEKKEIEKLSDSAREVYKESLKYNKLSSLYFSVNNLMGNLCIIYILWIGSLFNSAEQFGIGGLASFLIYFIYMVFSSANLGTFYSEYTKGVGVCSELFEIINSKKTNELIETKNKIEYHNLKKTIEFKNIYFKYIKSNKEYALKNFSLLVPVNKKTVIFGHSGSGKTTITSLLLKFYSPCSGNIYFDGKSIHNFSNYWIRSNIAIVSQKIELFSGTVLENLVYGTKGEAKLDENVIKASKDANLHNFVMKLPNGYNTVLENKGLNLSGGERQRISIARAILKNPKIYLFDEITSMLDLSNIKLIINTIEKIKDRTVIIITHSFRFLSACDLVVEIKDGKVIRQGEPELFTQKEK